MVKVVAKSLGEKYYKKKGYIKELVDDYVGLVVMNDTGKLFSVQYVKKFICQIY